MDVILTTTETELLPDLGLSVAEGLEHAPASVRQLHARIPGVASEPVTTAILVAVAGQATGVLAQQLFSTIVTWVKRHRAPVTVEAPKSSAEASNDNAVLITPENLADSEIRARLLTLLAATEA
jgi:hypothetical protein